MQPNVPFQSFQLIQDQLMLQKQQEFQLQQVIEMQKNALFDCWENQFIQPPPEGPYPEITHEKFNKLDIRQQSIFIRFLDEVEIYFRKTIPDYQIKMIEFIKKNQTYEMTTEEHKIMDNYLKKEQDLNKLEQINDSKSESNIEILQQSVFEVLAEKVNPEEPKLERQCLHLRASGFEQLEKLEPPKLPDYPNLPQFLDAENFKTLYQSYLDYDQPTSELTNFKSPKQEQKKQELKQQYNGVIFTIIDSQMYRRLEGSEKNRTQGFKEKKTNIDHQDITIFIEPDESHQPVNLVFIGHVRSGKSTLCGRILVDLNQISSKEIKFLQEEAIYNKRKSWFLAYCVDINAEERVKGRTIECGVSQFQTQNKRFTLFDTPGHKHYIPNMTMGACQADLAALIISARLGEFESGFVKGGQTKEHAFLAKSFGVKHLMVIVNKMDTVDWDKTRYDVIIEAIQNFLESHCKFESIKFIPIDALAGQNCSFPLETESAKWYKGPTLMEMLDKITIPKHNNEGPLRIPVWDKLRVSKWQNSRDRGLYIQGKLESGFIVDGQSVSLMPKKNIFVIAGIYNLKDQRMKFAKAGENVKVLIALKSQIKVRGLEYDDIGRGDVICDIVINPCQISEEFQVKIQVLELPKHKRILSQGYTCIMHLNCQVQQVEISLVEAVFDAETNKLIKQQFLKSHQEGVVRLQVFSSILKIEKYEFMDTLGIFALRDGELYIFYF